MPAFEISLILGSRFQKNGVVLQITHGAIGIELHLLCILQIDPTWLILHLILFEETNLGFVVIRIVRFEEASV